MPNLEKLEKVIREIRNVFKDDDSFEDLCMLLGDAIGIAGTKLQLLAYYDVNVVFSTDEPL